MVVLSILWSLSNASDVQSLARAVRIIESLTKSYETSNLTLFQNGGIMPLLDKILNNQSVWKLLQQVCMYLGLGVCVCPCSTLMHIIIMVG